MKKLKHISSKSLPAALRKCLAGSTAPLRGVGGLLVAFALLTSCSDELVESPLPETQSPSEISSDDIRFTIDLSIPSIGTRSGTEVGGGSSGIYPNGDKKTETAQRNESQIGGFTLYFFTSPDQNSWTFQEISCDAQINGNEVTAEISFEDMLKLAGNYVRIRLVGNLGLSPTLADYDDVTFGISSIEQDPLGAFVENGRTVPIANDDEFVVDFTDLTGSDTEIMQKIMALFDDAKTRVVNLSELKGGENSGKMVLERCVARFDYRPYGWSKGQANDKYVKKTYQVGEIENLYAQMYSVQLLNVSKENYVFRHASPGDRNTGLLTGQNPFLFGTEHGNSDFTLSFDEDLNGDDPEEGKENESYYNWIYDTDWTPKKTFFGFASSTSTWAGPYLNGGTAVNVTGNAATTGYTEYFLNQPTKGNTDAIYYVHPDASNKLYGYTEVYTIEDIMNGEEVVSQGLKSRYQELGLDDNYLPLFYMSENTLPSTASMINGLTTGLAFRMVLTDKDGALITPSTYFINAETYAENVRRRAELDAKTTLTEEEEEEYERIEQYFEDNEEKVVGSLTQANTQTDYSGLDNKWYILKIGTQEVFAEEVTINGTKAYLLTYYYYFRHNISHDHLLGSVEPMQFAVVRNNIYKLCVTALNGLPDPYVPGKHDEPKENDIAIETAILSWARVDKTIGL